MASNGLFLLYKSKITNYQLPITLILTLSFAALIGVFWEFFEFLYDTFISSRGYFGVVQLGAADTISDLFFDLLGASVFIMFYYFKLWRLGNRNK